MMHRGMRARPCRLGQALAVVALCGLLVSVAEAQQLPGPIRPLAAQPGNITWAEHNRAFTVNLGVQRQSYTENDPSGLTNDGTLDTERGTLRSAELGARWQAQSLPLLLQATARRSNGGTHYSGNMQVGSQITPYSATTANIMVDFAMRAGLPIAQNEIWQWVPFIEFQRRSWRRGLEQYTENFGHTACLAGLQVQWRQRANSEAATGPWSFEIEGAVGQMLAANMDVPSLAFDQPLSKRGLWQFGAMVGYDLTPQWRISTFASTRRFSYGQSAGQGGLVEPSSDTVQTTFGVGLGRRY